jgi:hypothetical protein
VRREVGRMDIPVHIACAIACKLHTACKHS